MYLGTSTVVFFFLSDIIMSANSTLMFQGLDPNARLSSKVLRPPGGGSTDIFGIHEPKGGQCFFRLSIPYLIIKI